MRVFASLQQDLRDAVRSLRRCKTVTLAAIVTLALGIGATTAIFSLVEAVMLRRLPIASPDRLFLIAHGGAGTVSTASHYPWFERVKQIEGMFDGVTAYNIRELRVSSADGVVERVVGQYASGNYHAVVGAPFMAGRGFSFDDDRVLTPVAVISHNYWSRRVARSNDVLGKTLVVGGRAVTIVGVTAAGFHGMQPGRAIDVTLPMSVLIDDDPEFLVRTDTWTSMPLVARLKPAVDIAEARSLVAAAYQSYMALPQNRRYSRTSDGQLRTATLQEAARGSDQLRRRYGTSLLALIGMVAVVLLITCANVANLLLMRAPARAREVAIRMAVGASRRRVAMQLLSESALLGACGGAVGLLLAAWGTEFVSWLFRTSLNPIVIDLQPDTRVVFFAIATSLLTGLIFGLAPAWRTTGIDLAQALKVGEARRRRGRRVGNQTLVGAQIAMCFVLVFGAGLFGRTLQNLRNVETGFQKDSVVVFALDALEESFDAARLAPLCTSVIDRMLTRPDVRSGSCSTMSPVATNMEGRPVTVPGSGREPRNTPPIYANSIDAGYFATLGIDVIRGRGITAQDTATSARVGVLSEGMARYFFGDTDPIGRTFRFGSRELGPPIVIVGIARDVRQQLRDPAPFMAYTPLVQRDEPSHALVAAIRTAGPTAGVAAAVRDELRAVTRDLAVPYVRTMDEQFGASLVGERLLTTLSGAFAILALGLACIGLYGVMSYDVTRRVRDIGIRLALGASESQILSQVLSQSVVLTIVGIVCGAAVALAVSQFASSFLFGLAPGDPGTLIATTLALTATSLVAGYFPARRASRVDPCVTLRME